MTSIYTTTQFDSPELLVNELLANLKEYDPANSIGIFICDSKVDCPNTLSLLQNKVPFPLVGGTALALPFSNQHNDEISASLMVLSKKGLKYSVSVSEPLDQFKAQEQMKTVYEQAKKDLGEAPKLIIPFFPCMPGVITDAFISVLFNLAENVPVFGGVITNDLISTQAAVFANGQCMKNRLALLVMGGDIKPVFAASNVITKMVEYAPVVTKSNGSIVSCVDDISFCDYMKSLGLSPEDRINGIDALMQYGPIPVQMQRKDKVDDGVPEVRCISFTNIDEGSVAFSGCVPEGTRVSVGILHKEDVDQSAKLCMEQLKDRMQVNSREGYEYSAMFCISCVARYFVLVGGDNTERSLLNEWQSNNHPAIGYYAMCEIGPTFAVTDNQLINRSHSASIVMCAL